ncbi:alpha/beta fold hydrolase [Pedococcus sp. NPDC057267]|uniref:bifunctional alpha/beta hydrolase/OsmC family protein n=1 Tax=Pedococcus sp. NPDC057267 TaxID=3346077 RepID=UPI003642B870
MDPTNNPGQAGRSSRTVRFPGADGRELVGTLDLPASGPPLGFALFAHCFTCTRASHAAAHIGDALARGGWGVLRFDFTGLGDSDGAFEDSTFSGNVEDLLAAASWLRRHHQAPALLIGHSLGGAAVVAAAESIRESRAVVTIGAPAHPSHVTALLTSGQPDAQGAREVSIGGKPFRLRSSFFDDIELQPQRERLARLGRALLVMHSPQDTVVGIDNARVLFDAARHPKSFVALDGTDHLMTDPADAAFAASIIVPWAARYVRDVDPGTTAGRSGSVPTTAAMPQTPPEPDNPGPGHVTVTEESATIGYEHLARVRGHSWVVDEPAVAGGSDAGPNPYELLLASLGACTSMTMRMYARRKGWTLGPSTVTLTHSRIHAQDCTTCESETGLVDHVHRDIRLDPALPPEQVQALLGIADRCPVHRLITSQASVTTSLVTA